MKKTMKALSALLLALILICSMCTAFATSTPAQDATAAAPAADSTADVRVATGNAADLLSAYRVVTATFDPEANTLDYAFTDLFEAFQASAWGGDYASMTVYEYCKLAGGTGSELEKVLGAFSAHIKGQEPRPAADYTATTDENGSATFPGVAMGQYIILGSGNTTGAYVYQTVTAEAVPTVNSTSGKYEIFSAYDVAMKTTKPDGAKTVTRPVQGGTEVPTANIGDVIGYQLTATLPTYSEGATNTTFYMGDTLSEGLTLKSAADEILVYGVTGTDTKTLLTKDADYTVSIDGQTLYINFKYDRIKAYAGVAVEYEAFLNEKAKIGEVEGNINSYELVYSNEPFNGSNAEPGTPVGPGYGKAEDQKKVYTYALLIDKFDKEATMVKLAGATFKIYADEGLNNLVGTITTDERGYAAYAGLKAGTYWLKETVAPSGYKLDPNPIKVVVDQDADNFVSVTTVVTNIYTTALAEAKVPVQATDSTGVKLWLEEGDSTGDSLEAAATQPDGKAPAYLKGIATEVTEVSAGSAADGYYRVAVANSKGSTLPTTGGMGTVIFTGVGATLMLGAAVLLITKKRLMNREK